MTTLGALKAEIADDMDDTSLATAVASAITRAIAFYQRKRFWFNETRDETYTTVASQAVYSSSDDSEIPDFYQIDSITAIVGGEVRELERITIGEWESYNRTTPVEGQPTSYASFNEKLYIAPFPDGAYQIRITGLKKIDAPASDDEANNAWMLHAFELIRARAKGDVFRNKKRNYEAADAAMVDEAAELSRLYDETASRGTSGSLTPTEF